jgi:heat-inducible transcriptional repressor
MRPAFGNLALGRSIRALSVSPGTQAVLQRTSHVLATLSSGVGVAIAAAADGDMLEHVHFSRLAEARVLAVVVTRSGDGARPGARAGSDLSLRELETAANFLNENFRGWSVERVRAGDCPDGGAGAQRVSAAAELGAAALGAAVPETAMTRMQTVYVEGVANLISYEVVGSQQDASGCARCLRRLKRSSGWSSC